MKFRMLLVFLMFAFAISVSSETLEEGINLFVQGDYENSKEIFQNIYTQQKGKNTLNEGLSLKYLGNIYMRYFDYKTAERYFIQALQVFNSLNNARERANTFNNLGALYKELKQYAQAQDSYGSAIKILSAENDFIGVNHVRINLAVLYEAQNKYGEAEKEYNKIAESIKENNLTDPELEANMYLGLGNLCYRQKKFDEALKSYVQANFTYTKAKLRLGMAFSLINMGISQRALNNNEAAVKSFIKAIEIIEDIRGQITFERSRSTFLEDKIFVYEQLIGAYLSINDIEKAYETVERAKAKTFLDMLGTRIVGEEKYNETLQDMIKKEKQLSLEIANKIETQDVSDLIEKRNKILNDINQWAPGYASINTVKPVTVPQLKSILGNDIILLDYFLGTEFSLVFIVSANGVKYKKLSAPASDIEDRVRKFRTSSTGSNMNILDTAWQDDLSWLYKILIEPVEDELDTKKIIAVVPHRSLHHLPFNALVVKKDSKNKTMPEPEFLIEKYKILMLPSAGVLKLLNSPLYRANPKEKILICANANYPQGWNPLEFAEEEANEIKNIFPDTTVKVKGDATETFIKNNSKDFKIIHLATHGILHPDTPLDSKILLSSDAENDGALTVQEIFNSKIKVSLVILSACESGKFSSFTSSTTKQLPYGDDVVGLTRAFIYSGTPFIISSLWEINDKSTKEFFIFFYNNLKTQNYINAFHNAQIQLMQSEKKYTHPNYWAPFQLYY